jgi:hypothetical protein
MKHLNEWKPQDYWKPRKFDATQVDRTSSRAYEPCDRAEIAQQRHKKLAGQGISDAAGGFARIDIRVSQNRQEVERSASKGKFVNLAELQISYRIDADEKQVGIRRVKGDEVSDVRLETSDFLAAGIEGVNQADLVSGDDRGGVTCA